MSRLHSHRALVAIAVVAALNSLSCSSSTNGASDESDNETTPQASSGETQASPEENSAANVTPIVRAYTDIAALCQRTEDCGTRPEGECFSNTPSASEVEAAVESAGWSEARQQQCVDAIGAWDQCTAELTCTQFEVLEASIFIYDEWLCTDEGGGIINCPSEVPCTNESEVLFDLCGEVDDLLSAIEPPSAALDPGVTLLDDGEDGNDTTVESDAGLIGYWYTFDDRCDCENPDPSQGQTNPVPAPFGGPAFTMSSYAEEGVPPAPLIGMQAENDYGIRVWGGGHLLSGGGVGVGLANQLGRLMPVDLTTHNWQSLRFQMRNGPGVAVSQDVEVIISDTYSEPSGGLCRPQPFEESPCSSTSDGSCTPQGCLDSPRVIVTSTSDWQTFEIPFGDFLRPGDGHYEPGVEPPPPSLDVTRAYQLQFRVPEGTPEFDLWIDNVGFLSMGP